MLGVVLSAHVTTALDRSFHGEFMPFSPQGETGKTRKSVWILDWQQSVREEIRDLLYDSGYSVRLLKHPKALFDSCWPDSPDCLVADYTSVENSLDGITAELCSKLPLPVIFMSHELNLATVVKAIRNGGFEFLLKPVDAERLLASVRGAIDDAQDRKLTIARDWDLRVKYQRLTKREKEVFPYVVSGYLNKQTAYELGISEVTVRIHRGRIMRKLGSESLADLVKSATRLGIMDI